MQVQHAGGSLVVVLVEGGWWAPLWRLDSLLLQLPCYLDSISCTEALQVVAKKKRACHHIFG